MVPEPEWNFWMDDGEMGRASKGRMTDLFHNNRRIFDALGPQGDALWPGTRDVAPGVTAVGTPGHSIGHTSSHRGPPGSAHVFPVQGDINNQSVVFSQASRMARRVRSRSGAGRPQLRRRVYEMLVAEKMPAQAYHHPFPGLGQVERDGTGFRVVPIA